MLSGYWSVVSVDVHRFVRLKVLAAFVRGQALSDDVGVGRGGWVSQYKRRGGSGNSVQDAYSTTKEQVHPMSSGGECVLWLFPIAFKLGGVW